MTDEPEKNEEKKPSPYKVAAALRSRYLRLMREGLGHDAISPDEERDLIAEIDDACSDVFLLYAKIELARSLGILPWFAAAIAGDFTTRGSDGSHL